MKPQDVLALCRERGVKAVDLRFMDFPGLWQHFTIPVSKLEEEVFEDGLGFDGSSIRGWQAINESDMILVPQPESAMIDPFMPSCRTLTMICNIQDPDHAGGLHARSSQRGTQVESITSKARALLTSLLHWS